MRTFLIFCGLWLGLASAVFAAETLTLADGSSVSGDIVKFDDYDVMIHTTADSYTNVAWSKFSQDALKQLSANPKYRFLAEPFIEPTAVARPAKPEIQVKYDQTVKLPEHPSLFGGLFHSSLGLFLLFLIYAANLYAAYEVAAVRGKPIGLVMGLAAVLPMVGQIIFLSQPMQIASEEAETAPEAGATAPEGTTPAPGQEEIQIVAASWQTSQEEKKPQPQVFSRGAFTLNKRFVETKFAGFIGEPKGDAQKFSMEIKTLKATIAVRSIKQVAADAAILETSGGPLTLPLADIQEIKLTPKPA